MEKLFQSEVVSKIADALLPVFATLAALAVGALMLLALGANPLEAFGALIEGAFGQSYPTIVGWLGNLHFISRKRDQYWG